MKSCTFIYNAPKDLSRKVKTFPMKKGTFPKLSNSNWNGFSLKLRDLSRPIHTHKVEAKKRETQKRKYIWDFLFNRRHRLADEVLSVEYGYDEKRITKREHYGTHPGKPFFHASVHSPNATGIALKSPVYPKNSIEQKQAAPCANAPDARFLGESLMQKETIYTAIPRIIFVMSLLLTQTDITKPKLCDIGERTLYVVFTKSPAHLYSTIQSHEVAMQPKAVLWAAFKKRTS